ncbi:uncharacterized protein [Panulirus ornatus]|uniref:uncharacterized protein n=1 Tax=Panulirus ornatus TaxID=150431 RepID=UPI003A871E3B
MTAVMANVGNDTYSFLETMDASSGEHIMKVFFTTEEWDSLPPIERTRCFNVLQRYKQMLKLGLSSKPPDFLQRYHDRLQQPQKTKHSSLVEGKANEARTVRKNLTQKELALKHKQDEKAERNLKSKIRKLKESFSEAISGKVKGPASNVTSDGVYPKIMEELKTESCSSLMVEKIQTKLHSAKKSWKTHYKCYVCGKKIYRKNELISHLRVHVGDKQFECNKCGHKFKELRNLKKHLSRTTANYDIGRFQCSYCSHTFTLKRSCKIHERIHSQNGKVPCCLCDLLAANMKHLRNHVRKVHLKEETECSLCGLHFSKPYYLKKHIKRVSKNFPFCCSVCGHRYSTKLGLRRHECQHGKIKSLQCTFCLKMFSHRSQLTKHLAARGRLKHYECSGCKKKFATHENLTKHMKIYRADRPFKCSECGHTFSSQGRLVGHFRLHSGESWKCKACGDTFRNRDFLKTHLQIHSRQIFDVNVIKSQNRKQDHTIGQPRLLDFAWPPKNQKFSFLQKLKSFRFEGPRIWDSLWNTQVLKQSYVSQHNQQPYLHQEIGCDDEKITESICIQYDSKKCRHKLCCQSEQESHHFPQDVISFHHSCQSNSEGELDVSVDVTDFDDAHLGIFLKHTFLNQQKPTVQKVCNIPTVCKDSGELHKDIFPVSDYLFSCTETVSSHSHHHQGYITKKKKKQRVQCPTCNKWVSSVSNLQRPKFVHINIKPYKCSLCKNRYCCIDTMKKHKVQVHGLQ